MKVRGILPFLLLFILILFMIHFDNESLHSDINMKYNNGNSDCIDAPNVASIEFQQSTVTLPSHETLLIQATLKDSSGAVLGIDPDWSAEYGSVTPIIGLQQARFTPGILSHTKIWACAGDVNESLTINVIQGTVENLIIQASQENFTADDSVIISLQGEDIRGNVFTLIPPEQNWSYPLGSILSISDEITWNPTTTGWQNISVQESGIIVDISFNITHGVPIKLSIIGESLLITSDESMEMISVLVDIDGNEWPVISNWSTYHSEASEWLTDMGDMAIFDGHTMGAWKILTEYINPETEQFFAAEYDILVSVGELNQILLNGHGLTFTVDEALDLNPRAIDSAGNLIPNVEMIWTINGQVSTGALEDSNYLFSPNIIGLYEIQVTSEGGSASITCDFIHGDAVRIVVTEIESNLLVVKSGQTIELLTEGEDQFGNRFALNVNWTLTNGTGEMSPSSSGIGYYDFKPGDVSGFVIMEYSGLGLVEQIVIEIKPGDITKLRIGYDGELKQGHTVRLLISAVDDSENVVSVCDANSAIVTSEIGKVIRDNEQLYMKLENAGSATIEVGCFGFQETFYLQVEKTILWGVFEDTQTVIIYASLILMIAISVLLFVMIQRSREEYEEFEELPALSKPKVAPDISSFTPVVSPFPLKPLPLPPLPLPPLPLPLSPHSIQQPVPQQQPVVKKIETEDKKLDNAMNLLDTSDSKQAKSNLSNPKFDPIDEEDLDWD